MVGCSLEYQRTAWVPTRFPPDKCSDDKSEEIADPRMRYVHFRA